LATISRRAPLRF